MASSSNNPVNNKVGANISGVTNTFTVTNPSNTASSAARETITVGGTSSGNPTLNFNVLGSTDWEMGINNSDSQALTIAQSTALGTKNIWRANKAGLRTMPLQSCMAAQKTFFDNNSTGDGTALTCIWDSVLIDQASNYNNATGIFTAPINGTYIFTANIFMNGISAGHTVGRLDIYKNGVAYLGLFYGNPANISAPPGGSNGLDMNNSSSFPLIAGDTIKIVITISGSTKTINVGGGIFSVALLY